MPDEGFVEVNGARIHYRAEGEGTPMLLVHGYPLTGDLFREQRAALSGRPNFQPVLGRIDVPVLILVGLQETIYPPKISQRMGRMIPNAEVVVIDDASHAAVIEEGERVNDAIRDWAAGMR